MMDVHWCTRDWGGGSNYGPYRFRTALRIARETKNLGPWDRQAVTLVVRMARAEWTVDFTPRLRVRKRHDAGIVR